LAGTLGIYGGMRLEFGGGAWSGGHLDSCCNGGGVWANQGQLDITATPLTAYRGVLENNATLRIAPGANLIWDQGNGTGLVANLTTTATPAVVQFDGTGQIGGVMSLNNEGIVRKTGAGTSVFDATLRNKGASSIYPGSIEVLEGTLALADQPGFTEARLYTEGGVITVAAGAVLAVRDGGQWRPFPEPGAYQVYTTSGSGAGHVRLETGGTLHGFFRLPNQAAPAVIAFAPGMFEWTGGAISDFVLRNEGEITISGTDAKTLSGAELENAGTIKLMAPTLQNGGILHLLAGSLMETINDSAIVSGGNNPQLIVDGTLRKLAGAGSFTLSDMNLAGTGTVEIIGGHLALPEVGSFYRMASFNGTLALSAGAVLDAPGGVPLVTADAGVVGVGGFSSGQVEQRGRIEPGAPYGAIAAAGNLQQNNTAVTRIAIGGTAPVTQYAQLQVGGDLYGQGTLKANFRDGFAPLAGNSFDLITVGGNLTNGIGSYQVINEGLAPGFQYTLTISPQKTVRLTALNNVLSLADYVFADGFEE
jgi:hypothetical protein